MKCSMIQSAVFATALAVCTTLSLAAESKTGVTGQGAEKKASAPAKKAAPKVKPVDINSASKAELMKIQGIGDADADRIIANRPYLSKAHLVTRKVIPHGIYEQIKRQIIAMQKPAATKK